MKKILATAMTALLLLSSCGTTRGLSGDAGATLAGASIGGQLGSAIGGLIGDNNRGPQGGMRGSAIGSIIGTIAGAAIANAATTPQTTPAEEEVLRVERTPAQSDYERMEESPRIAAMSGLKIRNIRFIDDSRDHIISSGESSKVIFEIVNEGQETAYNVVPVVSETTGMKNIYISPSVVIEQIVPGDGVKYTANIQAQNRIKTGEIVIHLAVSDDYGEEYDRQEFTLQTQR